MRCCCTRGPTLRRDCCVKIKRQSLNCNPPLNDCVWPQAKEAPILFESPLILRYTYSLGGAERTTLGTLPSVLTLPYSSLTPPSPWIPIVRYDHSPCNSLVVGPPVLPFRHFQRYRRCPFPSWKEDRRGFIWCRFRRYLFLLSFKVLYSQDRYSCALQKAPIS